MEQKLDPSLTQALAPAVSFFVMQYRVKDVTPDPKSSNAVLVTAAATTSFCTGQNAVICRKDCTASLLQTGLGHHQHGLSTGTDTAV